MQGNHREVPCPGELGIFSLTRMTYGVMQTSTMETVNADLKTYRGLGPFLVRGLRKVRCVALWSALAYNVMHFAGVLVS